MIELSKGLYFPDEKIPGIMEIKQSLIQFGLKENEFTFAPACGGVLVFSLREELLWLPKEVFTLLGTRNIEAKHTTQDYLIKGAAVATVAGITGYGILPIYVGYKVGKYLGDVFMKKLLLRDPPNELLAYPSLLIDRLELLSPSFIYHTFDSLRNTLSQIEAKKDRQMFKYSVLAIIKRFHPLTEEAKQLMDKMKREEHEKLEKQNELLVVKAIRQVADASISRIRKVFDQEYLVNVADAIRLEHPSHYEALLATLKAHNYQVIEK